MEKLTPQQFGPKAGPNSTAMLENLGFSQQEASILSHYTCESLELILSSDLTEPLQPSASRLLGVPGWPQTWAPNISHHPEIRQYEELILRQIGYPSPQDDYASETWHSRPWFVLAQINLQELPHFDNRSLLPKSGILYFVAKAQSFDWPAYGRVLFYDGDHENLSPNYYATDEYLDFDSPPQAPEIFTGLPIKWRPHLSHLNAGHDDFENPDTGQIFQQLQFKEQDILHDSFGTVSKVPKLCVYPTYLLGWPGNDPIRYSPAQWCLFQYCEIPADWWPDTNYIGVWTIDHDDLLAHRFNNARFTSYHDSSY